MGRLGGPCKVSICGMISLINLPGAVGLGVPIFQGPTAVEELSDFPGTRVAYRIYGGPTQEVHLGPATMSPFGSLSALSSPFRACS